jgi:hypothetical protein
MKDTKAFKAVILESFFNERILLGKHTARESGALQ